MFHSRNLNNKINRTNKRTLRSVFQNNLSFFELLDLDNSVKKAATKICKFFREKFIVINEIAPEKMKDILNYKISRIIKDHLVINLGEKT